MRAAVTIPFTVKFRMGWNDKNIVCVGTGEAGGGLRTEWPSRRARTREDGYSGNARWQYIAAIKDAVKIPVIGNGDIVTPRMRSRWSPRHVAMP